MVCIFNGSFYSSLLAKAVRGSVGLGSIFIGSSLAFKPFHFFIASYAFFTEGRIMGVNLRENKTTFSLSHFSSYGWVNF